MLDLVLKADVHDRQVRQGISNTTKGTAFVVYEDVVDAKQACDKLNGFNFQNRYLVGMSYILALHESRAVGRERIRYKKTNGIKTM